MEQIRNALGIEPKYNLLKFASLQNKEKPMLKIKHTMKRIILCHLLRLFRESYDLYPIAIQDEHSKPLDNPDNG